MLVVLMVCEKDLANAHQLLSWIALLDGKLDHDCLIVCDAGVPYRDALELRDQARTIFRETRFTTNNVSVKGWPAGAYSLFKSAVRYVAEKWPQPFLLLEPDCVPIKKGWLDELWDSYHNFCLGPTLEGNRDIRDPFMGHIYDCVQPGLPKKLMSGIAVYPADTATRFVLREEPVHWDVDNAEVMVSQGVHTPLIKHFFGGMANGQVDLNLAPTFVVEKTANSPVNAFDLAWLDKTQAVLFHRNKDGSLIRLLKRRLFPETNNKIVVVFNVFVGDIALAEKHARWLQKMGMKSEHKAIVAYDISCPIVLVQRLIARLKTCFAQVDTFVYPRPQGRYPHTANQAWQHTALHMAKQDCSWFWFEADAIALRKDWIEQLQAEYDRANKSWMGVIVPHMDHLTGCAVYPPDAAARMPSAMKATDQAWDMLTKEEVVPHCHNSRLMFHVWSLVGGMPHPVGGGDEPRGITPEQFNRWPIGDAVFLHRIKDSAILDGLLNGTITL